MIDFNLQNLSQMHTSTSQNIEPKTIKKNNSVASNLGRTEKKSSNLDNSSKFYEKEIELFIHTKEKSNTYSSPHTFSFSSKIIKEKEKVLTPTSPFIFVLNTNFQLFLVCPKKYVNYKNMNYCSGGNSPLNIEEDMLIPNFDFIEEDKFVDFPYCKICKKNFKYFQEIKINW